MASCLLVLYLCCLHCITVIHSQCQYVAYNWDLVTDSDKAGAIRKYMDDTGATAYLPPFPKVFGGIYNESWATIPYPIDVCLQTDNTDTNILSYKWICENEEPTLQIWRNDVNCTGEWSQNKEYIDLFVGGLLEYDCDNELEACEYVYISEEYYSYNDTSINSDKDTCNINENDKLGETYNGAYAVDVCIKLENNMGSFQYSCDSRTATYTLTQYSDTRCTSIASSQIIGTEKRYYEQGTECATDFILDVVNLGQNLTADYDDSEDAIEFMKSTFVKCTSADEFELAFKDYCVASQVTSMDADENYKKTVMTRFGPFGVRSISEKQLSRIIACDPCDVIHNCRDEWLAWDQTILLIDANYTQTIITQCTAKQFVLDIESIQNVTINGIIFASDHNVSHIIRDENDITIPIRIMSTSRFDDQYFGSFPFFNATQSVSTKVSSLSCNYRDGYPTEVCVTASCHDINFNSTEECPRIKFAGTYFIQNMSNSIHKHNSNPIWIKESYGAIPIQYIWLQAIVSDDEFVELRWIISSEIGNATAGLYCSIADVNEDDIDAEALGNFDVTDCKWYTITPHNNDTSTHVESAPYQCFNNLFNVPITFLCVSTYKSNTTEITNYAGTYYELASGSAIYMQNKSDTTNNVDNIGLLKLDFKYECEFEIDSSEVEQSVYNGYYAFYKMVPEECTPIKGEYYNLNWILFDSLDNKIKAYCDSMELASDPSLSVTACNQWFVWDEDEDSYAFDDSFDVDIDECTHENDIYLPQFTEYSDSLCFELNLNDSEEFIYSSVQYLWGQYTKLDSSLLFDNRPIYQNNRLINTSFATYLLWYDPKDAWVFITKSDLLSQHLETRSIFNSFDGLINALENVIVAFCDNNNDDETLFPEECLLGWTANDELISNLSLAQYTNDSDCSGVRGLHADQNPTFTKDEEVNDLCVAFYERVDDCILPKEQFNALNKKPLECEAPSYFETSDWCNKTEDEECRTLDGNGIYTQFGDRDVGFERSYWIHEVGDDDDEVFYYVYYHELLRLWVWSTDNGDYGNKADDVEAIKDLGIGAYCLEWNLNVPDKCVLFYYEEYDDMMGTRNNASSEVDDCTIHRDNSKDLVGEISAWVILSCFGCGFCVFCIGFYREYMQKRHMKKQSARVSILGSGTEVDVRQHLDINQTSIIEEQNEEQIDEPDMNAVASASSGDAINGN